MAGEVLGEVWAVAGGAGPVDVRVFVRGITNYPFRISSTPQRILSGGVALSQLVIQNLGIIPIEIGNDRSLLYGQGMRIPPNSILSNGAITPGGASLLALEQFTRASIPAAGTAGRTIGLTDYDRGLWIDNGTNFWSLGAEVFNAKAFGAHGDGVTDDTVAINAAIAAARASTQGGVVICPRSDTFYLANGGIDLNGAEGVALVGFGGRSNGGGTATWLRCTANIARVIDMRNSIGCALIGMLVQANNAAFNGIGVDLSGSNNFDVRSVQWQIANTGIGLDLSDTILGLLTALIFNAGAGGSIGIRIAGNSTTTLRMRGIDFKCLGAYRAIVGTAAVEIDGLVADGITLDGIGNCTANLIDFSGTLLRGARFAIWSGDMGAGSSNSIIHLGAARGIELHAGFIAGAGTQVGVNVGANARGLTIKGEILGVATGVNFGAGVRDVDLTGLRNLATVPIAGAPVSGLIANNGGLQIDGASTIFAGAGVPAAGLGANGDYYFDQTGGAGTHIYFKAGGAWGAIA